MGWVHKSNAQNSQVLWVCLCFFVRQWPQLADTSGDHVSSSDRFAGTTGQNHPTPPCCSEQTQPPNLMGLGVNEASNQVLLLPGWVGGFWHSQPVPKSRISSQKVGRIPVLGNSSENNAGACMYFLSWRDSKRKLLQTTVWRSALVFVPDGVTYEPV